MLSNSKIFIWIYINKFISKRLFTYSSEFLFSKIIKFVNNNSSLNFSYKVSRSHILVLSRILFIFLCCHSNKFNYFGGAKQVVA